MDISPIMENQMSRKVEKSTGNPGNTVLLRVYGVKG